MSAIFIVLLASLAVAIIFLAAYLWSVNSGQYDDDYSPAIRILFDTEKNEVTESLLKPSNLATLNQLEEGTSPTDV